MLADPYFLETITTNSIPRAPQQIVPLPSGGTVKFGTRLSLTVRSYEQQPTVQVFFAGKELLSQTEVDDYSFTLSKVGKAELRIVVKDVSGRVAGEQKLMVEVL